MSVWCSCQKQQCALKAQAISALFEQDDQHSTMDGKDFSLQELVQWQQFTLHWFNITTALLRPDWPAPALVASICSTPEGCPSPFSCPLMIERNWTSSSSRNTGE